MKKILLILFIIFISSCSPKIYVIGFGMRKFNTSKNKYNKKHPYIKSEKKIGNK